MPAQRAAAVRTLKVGIPQRVPDGSLRAGSADPEESEDGGGSRLVILRGATNRSQRGNRGFSCLHQKLYRAILHRGSRVFQQFRGFRGRRSGQVQLAAARILHRSGADFSNAINRALHLRLGDAGNRTTVNEPCPRIQHEHASIRVLDHVGGVKIGIAGGEEIGIFRAEGGSLALHHMRCTRCGLNCAVNRLSRNSGPNDWPR
jgi:hypothetical protein